MWKTSTAGFKYKCLKCGGIVTKGEVVAICSQCAASWPIVDGVIFFETADYWGEMGTDELNDIINTAGTKGWKEAIESCYKDSDESMFISIMDLNRASWPSLLPIPYESTVLDVGSGLGAITHSLANNYRKVISMEAVPDRVRFSSLRIKQQALDGVEIIQAGIMNMPFLDESFDLIILNGILEWVGEWDESASPKEIQLNVLRNIFRLLKPNGMLLIGIENRIGYNMFFGGTDHSGVGYTSLMPRKMASLYLKLKAPRHHRKIGKKTDYRTYTYSRRGYMKLLREAGFRDISFYTPNPGYNRPYNIIPQNNKYLMKDFHLSSLNSSIRIGGYNWRRRLKKIFVQTDLINELVSDFVITARKNISDSRMMVYSEESVIGCILRNMKDLPDRADLSNTAFSLYTRPLINKHVLTIYNRDGTQKLAVAKISNIKRDHAYYAEEEFNILKKLHRCFENQVQFLPSIPQPLFVKKIGNNIVAVETAVNGERFYDKIMKPDYFKDKKKIDHDLNIVTNWMVTFYKTWDATGNKEFRRIGKEFYDKPESDQVSVDCNDGDHDCDILQHGDFFTKNIFFQEGKIFVIDWEHAGQGYPPLFDFFCLAQSFEFMQGIHSRPSGLHIASLKDTFFSRNWFSDMILKHMINMANALGFNKKRLPQYFFDFLIVRYNSFRLEADKRDYHLVEVFKDQIDFFLRNKEQFIAAFHN